METFLNIIPIIVPTIVVVGVMVFVSYRNKMLLIIIRSEYHQSYALFLMWYLSLELLFLFLLCYIPMNILFSFGFYLPACLL